MIRQPRFWREKTLISKILMPLSWLYHWFSLKNQKGKKAVSVDVPVICVGNLVMGGAGKTPTVIALVKILKNIGFVPHILSRGYGAIIKDTVRVDPDTHHYLQVGDEPLLLARHSPTWAGTDRVLSARKAIAEGATILVMDDGLQSQGLKKDFSILVIDGMQGFGNKQVFPAGPLREPVSVGLARANIITLVGDNNLKLNFDADKTFKARIHADRKGNNEKVIAFAGLGYPEKFYNTLVDLGYDVVDFIAYADHHPYTLPELKRLIRMSNRQGVKLITTVKDSLRIPNSYLKNMLILPITFEFEDEARLTALLSEQLIYSRQDSVKVE